MNNTYPHPLIAREGWPYLGGILIVTLIVQAIAGFAWAWPLWLLVVFVLQFFRDPARAAPAQANAILSPADGRIVAIEPARDPFADRDALKISVFMNVFNVHSNRAPIDGIVQQIQYFGGRFFSANLDKASLENERNAVVLRRADGRIVTSVQIAGLIARRILCDAKVGQMLARGQRYGFIRFGSRVDVYLPLTARARVSPGEKVCATSTVLAELD